MPPLLIDNSAPEVSRAADDLFKMRQTVEAEMAEQSKYPLKGGTEPEDCFGDPKTDPEIWTAENIDYCEFKIIVAYRHYTTALVPVNSDVIVFLLKSVTKARSISDQCENAVALFLTDSNPRIVEAARAAVWVFQTRRKLLQPWRKLLARRLLFGPVMRATSLAMIQWIDDDCVVCRFLHPQEGYGEVEREFKLPDLRAKLFGKTKGKRRTEIEEGGTFMLEMEQDETGHVVEYLPMAGSYKKGDGPEDPFDGLRLPDDIEDEQAMAEYDQKRRRIVEARIQAEVLRRMSGKP